MVWRENCYSEHIGRRVSSGETERIPLGMNGFDSPTMLWLLIAAQCVGFGSAWLARLSEGSCCQAISQCLFVGILPIMGVVTALAFAVSPGWWLACSATLAAMVLTVTCDFRRGREAATW